MKIVFSAYARRELDLEAEFEGLGSEFRSDVRSAAERISRHPVAWPVERGEVRKCLLHKFPYKLLYSVENDHVFIIAVAHQHRQPDYWIERL